MPTRTRLQTANLLHRLARRYMRENPHGFDFDASINIDVGTPELNFTLWMPDFDGTHYCHKYYGVAVSFNVIRRSREDSGGLL